MQQKVSMALTLFGLFLICRHQPMQAQSNAKLTTGKISCQEKWWAAKHPIIAKMAFHLTSHSLAVTDSLRQNEILDGNINGGQLDAFKHAYWMATLAQKFNWKKAKSLGLAHEKANYKSFVKADKKGVIDGHDQVGSEMDLWNNEKGLAIGMTCTCCDENTLIQMVLDSIADGKMKIIWTNPDGKFLDAEGRILNAADYERKWFNGKCICSIKFKKMKDTLIINGLIHTPDRIFEADILIKNGIIAEVSEKIQSFNSETLIIDAIGKFIFPGGIDPHVHMELPSPAGNSCDDFYSGSRAALAGGTTALIDFVTPARGESFIKAFRERKKLASKSLVDCAFHVSPTWWGNESAKEMEILVKEYGVNSFKCYLAYQDKIGIKDDVLTEVMKNAKKLDSIVTLHCEIDEIIQENIAHLVSEGKLAPKFHPVSRPPEAEVQAVKKAIHLAAQTDCRIYIVHVSTGGAADLIRKAQKSGMEVYAETCPQYLLLNDGVYDHPFEKSAPFVMSPPLRKKEDQQALWEGISDGTIQTVGTDHCPFNLEGQKDKGIENFIRIPNGTGGVEHRLSLLYTFGVLTHRISVPQFIKITTENPASIFKLKNKGLIKPDFDADLLIWNPEKESVISAKTHFQNCDSNIYEGIKVRGGAEMVLTNGQIAFENNRVLFENLTRSSSTNESI